MFIVALDEGDVVYLAWAGGLATGSGNTTAATALQGILDRLTPYDPNETPETVPEQQEVVDAAVQEEQTEREADPQFVPPVAPPRYGYETGAGPVPDGILG